MADSGAAQNKLGELFVDIGVGGLGKTLKALNSVSASFLLTKNAATQAVKPIIDVGKRTMSMAVDVGKLGSTLGLAYKDAYKLQYYFKHMNLNDGLVNDLERISEQFSLIAQGQSQLSGEQMLGFANLGMSWQKYYGGGFNKAQQFIKDLQVATANMDRTKAATSLQQIGVSTDWLYAFDRGTFDLSDALSISNEEINAAITAQEDLNAATLSLQQAMQKLVITITPLVSEYAPKLTDAITRYSPVLVNSLREHLPIIAESLSTLVEGLGGFLKKRKARSEKLGQWIGDNESALKFWGLLPHTESDIKNELLDKKNQKDLQRAIRERNKKIEEDFKRQFHPTNAVPDPLLTPTMPGNISNSSNIVNITNNITGQNAAEIAQRTTNNTQFILKNMLYNPYQVHNLPGK